MKKIFAALTALTITASFMTACSGNSSEDTSVTTEITAESVSESVSVDNEDSTTETEEQTEAASETEANADAVAGGNETVAAEEVVEDGMTPVYGSSIKDGTYNVAVKSSSSMFNITSCALTVENGEMTAVMTMGGKGYLYVFMGTGEEAAASDESGYIPFTENENGEHTFTVPVEALDMGIDCSAFSAKKEKWYDRTILFRMDSLPSDAFEQSFITTVTDLGLSDGSYTVDVKLDGGSGRASVTSPAKLTVENGNASVELIWSSSKYDYMIVNDEKLEPVNTEGNSTFVIPVTGFDYRMPVRADTTAMSTPYEIEYTLYFDSASICAE